MGRGRVKNLGPVKRKKDPEKLLPSGEVRVASQKGDLRSRKEKSTAFFGDDAKGWS